MASRRPYKDDPNHYEVLGVAENAKTDLIKHSYRKLTLVTHPDKAKKDTVSQKEAAEEFRKVRAAWEVLDKDRRGFDRELAFRRRDAKRARAGETGRPSPPTNQPNPEKAQQSPGGGQPGYGFAAPPPGFAPRSSGFSANPGKRSPTDPAYPGSGPNDYYFAYPGKRGPTNPANPGNGPYFAYPGKRGPTNPVNPGSGPYFAYPGKRGPTSPANPGSGPYFAYPGDAGAGYRRPAAGGADYRRPGAGGADYKRPGAGGADYRRPGAGGADYKRPGAGGADYRRPGAGGADNRRPEAGGADYKRPGGGGVSYKPSGPEPKGGSDDGKSLDDDFWKSRGYKNQDPNDLNAFLASGRKDWLRTTGQGVSGEDVQKIEAVMRQLLKSQIALSSMLGSLTTHFHFRRATESGKATSRVLRRIIFLVGEAIKANEENSQYHVQVYGGLAYGASVSASTIPLTIAWGRRLIQNVDLVCEAIAMYDIEAFGTLGKASDIELARKLESRLMGLPPIRAL